MNTFRKTNKNAPVPYADATIKVLMLGASRVGKTSILANMTSRETFETVVAGTNLRVSGEPTPSVSAALHAMQDYFNFETPVPGHPDQSKDINRDMTLCDAPSMRSEDFTVSFSTADARRSSYTIGFKDIPGELVDKFANSGNAGLTDVERNNLTAWVSEADVIMVTVDSVLMLEEDGNNAVYGNRINEVCGLLKDFCDPDKVNNVYKQILFVPVKCEKYYVAHLADIKSNGGEFDPDMPNWMLDLNFRIREKYRVAFDHFAKYPGVFQVAITPILTLGNLKFSRYSLNSNAKTAQNMLFTYHFNDVNDILNGIKPKFAPMFCEQPLIYIMYFELLKIRKLNETRGFFSRLLRTLKVFTSGLAKDDEMMAEMDNLKRNLKRNTKEDGWYTAEIVQDPMKMSQR